MHRLLYAIVLVAFGTPALAHVVEKEVREFYDVRQSAGMSLLDALNATSPVREKGQTFHGHTAWEIRWNFRWQVSGAGLCEITSATTHVSVKMTLPRLVMSTKETNAQFQNYYPALLAHEQGHGRNAIDAAHQIDRAIAGLRPMSDCQALEREANRTGLAMLNSARQRDIEYDAKTQHGCTQGACLPASR